MQRRADLARLQTAIQLAHTNLTEPDLEVFTDKVGLCGFAMTEKGRQEHISLVCVLWRHPSFSFMVPPFCMSTGMTLDAGQQVWGSVLVACSGMLPCLDVAY